MRLLSLFVAVLFSQLAVSKGFDEAQKHIGKIAENLGAVHAGVKTIGGLKTFCENKYPASAVTINQAYDVWFERNEKLLGDVDNLVVLFATRVSKDERISFKEALDDFEEIYNKNFTDFLTQYEAMSGDGLKRKCTNFEEFTHSTLANIRKMRPVDVANLEAFIEKYLD